MFPRERELGARLMAFLVSVSPTGEFCMSKAKIVLLTVVGCLLANSELNAQKGTAPDGYYPSNYSGSTFTGSLQPASKDTPGFTLIYTRGGKSETFYAQLESKCKLTNKAGVTQSFGMEAFSEGAVLTVYYTTSKNKNTHEKQNVAIAISFAEKKGNKIPDDMRIIIMCTEHPQLQLKGFSAERAGPMHDQ
jgi:hypothetical protein